MIYRIIIGGRRKRKRQTVRNNRIEKHMKKDDVGSLCRNNV